MTTSPASPRRRSRPAGTVARGTPARPTAHPTFRTLSARAATALLRRNGVGRLAFCFHDRVDVEPINYVHDGPWLFGRTSPGTKLTVIRHSPWVAFEVDEVSGIFDWQSVVVHGTLYTMEPDGPSAERRAWQRGMSLLRRFVPETGSAEDPVPFRTVVFGIHVDAVSGRSASSS